MKRLLLISLLPLVGCSVDGATEDSIAPLVTTGITSPPTSVVVATIPEPSNEMFLEQVSLGLGGTPPMTDLELLARGQEYCDAARMGMNHGTLHLSIDEAAYTPEQTSLEHVILHQALTWLCQDQEYRVNP